jgi:hypothetical protein
MLQRISHLTGQDFQSRLLAATSPHHKSSQTTHEENSSQDIKIRIVASSG